MRWLRVVSALVMFLQASVSTMRSGQLVYGESFTSGTAPSGGLELTGIAQSTDRSGLWIKPEGEEEQIFVKAGELHLPPRTIHPNRARN